jgi:hypothetical protein
LPAGRAAGARRGIGEERERAVTDRIDAYAEALSTALGQEIVPSSENAVVLYLDGRQEVALTRDGEAGVVRIVTPLHAAHDGLPAEILDRLLQLNAPSEQTAAALLRRRRRSDCLELVNVIPVTVFPPESVARLAVTQAEAAVALAREIDAGLGADPTAE